MSNPKEEIPGMGANLLAGERMFAKPWALCAGVVAAALLTQGGARAAHPCPSASNQYTSLAVNSLYDTGLDNPLNPPRTIQTGLNPGVLGCEARRRAGLELNTYRLMPGANRVSATVHRTNADGVPVLIPRPSGTLQIGNASPITLTFEKQASSQVWHSVEQPPLPANANRVVLSVTIAGASYASYQVTYTR